MAENFYKRALFLDRDGTLNHDEGYTHIFQDKQIIANSPDLINHANKLGFMVIIVTNQSGIGRGLYSEAIFHKYMGDLQKYYASHDAIIHDYFFAPYYKTSPYKKYRQGVELRKPNVGMFELAKQKHLINLRQSILIGDKFTDIKAGANANIAKLILFNEQCTKVVYHNQYIEVNELKAVLDLPIW